ncbi:hypothetical protein KRR26_14190 [Corallococcus sp. M34]|uniref:hypothetical protein n=1 Tax=Citreicoccus inhibens TaxID=2849499 RepID=UPI001C234219|nr:hypothetical protein [Citreicoccus inhibens]MBU8896764.1 hypothetical protein [Citreicoccus inhibens]
MSDFDFDRFSGQVDAEAVYSSMSSFLKCHPCRRLWVFWNGFSAPPEEFVPAKAASAPHAVLA